MGALLLAVFVSAVLDPRPSRSGAAAGRAHSDDGCDHLLYARARPHTIGCQSAGCVLLLLMRSGLTSTKRQEGWVSLPKVAFQQIGLGDRFKRKDASRRLVRVGVVETRRPGPGASLEYRLLPVEQWGQR